MAWNPWRELRDLPDVTLRLVRLDPPNAGLLLRREGRIEIHIDRRLDQRARRAVLAHELVHLERGPVHPHDAAREEAVVNREVARRLVPPEELEDFIRARASFGEHVTLGDVAEEFDVPQFIARLATPTQALDIQGL